MSSPLFLLLWLSIPSGFLVVFEKPNRSSFTFTFTPCFAHVPRRREIRGLQQDIVCDKLGVTQARTQLTAYGGATPGASARLGECRCIYARVRVRASD